MLTFTVAPVDHTRRMESFLRTLMPKASAGYARKLIKSGAAKVNGSAVTPDTFLLVKNRVTLKESGATTELLAEKRPVLDILYEDDQILVANKPPGLPMHQTAEREANLVDLGIGYMSERGTACKLYPVNRLDRGTSGVVIMAKSSTNAGMYGRQVKETGLDKLYLALVIGTPDESGIINTPLDDKESETHYRILLRGRGCSLLEVRPISGRLHQIRRHLEMIGHPVMGDKRYSGGVLPGLSGFALHSFRTILLRTETGQLTVCAPLSKEMLDLCAAWEIEAGDLLERVGKLVT